MVTAAPTTNQGICFSDEPAVDPVFEFGDNAKILADRILSAGPRPFSVGIFGGYGSGKTTLLQSIWRSLREPAPAADGLGTEQPVHCLWFDAWRYAQGSDLFLAFLALLSRDEVLTATPEHKGVAMDALRSFAAGITLNLGFGELDFEKVLNRDAGLSEAKVSALAKAAAGFHDIPDYLRKLAIAPPGGTDGGRRPPAGPSGRRVIVFVDDLDRCAPEDAFRMIETIKSLTDIPGWTWVFALDPRVLNAQVASKYQKRISIAATEYFEKIFNLTFVLPAPEAPMTAEALKGALYGTGTSISQERLEADLVTQIGEHAAFLPANVRQIKRILNNAQTLCAINGGVDTEIIILLSIMKTRWPLLFGILQEAEGPLKGAFDEATAKEPRPGASELATQYRRTVEWCNTSKDGPARDLWLAVTSHRTDPDIRWVLRRLGLEVDLRSALKE